jgi:hypothetical protein
MNFTTSLLVAIFLTTSSLSDGRVTSDGIVDRSLEDEITGTGEDMGEQEWMPGPVMDPLTDDEVREILDLLPKTEGPFKDLEVASGKGQGQGKGNINRLVHSGKPFLLNGLDEETREAIMDELGIGLPEENQPFLIVVPQKTKGQTYFQVIDGPAPHFPEGVGSTDMKKEYLAELLFKSEDMANAQKRKDNRDAAGGPAGGGTRNLATGNLAVPNKKWVYSKPLITWRWSYSPGLEFFTFWDGILQGWFNYEIELFKTDNANDLVIATNGHWNSNYIFDDANSLRGYANGHMTYELNAPDGFNLLDYMPKNINNINTVSESKGFQLSGSVSGNQDGVGGGGGASYSETKTISYPVRDWEILANGYNKWDFKQALPFKVGESPMYSDFYCFWEGGCLHPLPALSRGTFNFETVSHISGDGTGWQYLGFKQTGRSYRYQDTGWFSSTWTWWTRWVSHGLWLNLS